MQGTYSTPYNDKGEASFWRTAVASITLGQDIFPLLHQITLNINNPRISSIGSCFAQHVGQWLNAGGYRFNQSKLEMQQVSSFAFGNLYTPRCLLQWLNINYARKPFDTNSAIYIDNNKFYDLLRPSFNPAGFDSQTDLVAARIAAAAEMRTTLVETDVLILTLGLTEAWKDSNDVYYPSCPGVISGLFDDSIYQFHNFSYEELRGDLEDIASQLNAINPNIHIILTVSPVPLTATMTDKHIMVANQHSKSLLRTVAGFLSDNNPRFSYFPSYEIITVPCAQDFRFETNLRSVTPQAINYVMQHFRSVIDKTVLAQPRQEQKINLLQAKVNRPDNNEVVCEEELLETTKRLNTIQVPQTKYNVTLFGDSHMSKLSNAFNNISIQHCGGMVMNGSGFSNKKFSICDTEYFVPLESAISRKLWSAILGNLHNHEQSGTTSNSTIITNLAMQTHRNLSRLGTWLKQAYPEGITKITTKDFVDYFNDDLIEQMSILLKLHEHGHRVIVVSDPPFSQYFEESSSFTHLIYAYFDAMEYVLTQLGITFFNAATTFDTEIADPENYTSTIVFPDNKQDWAHGNDRYYTWLAQKLAPLLHQNAPKRARSA
ncbi:GSCFA domain-containing protein [Shewanella sp. VB17]|uniref:GSCFA domain-containing protein n=1 Tax=Shewanella sp. VB17 TaxID=2739432 RepID=UPI001564F46A|nr:GSCFA domain-containing protein [Shewanella sp. VB17]NRD73314.1 GSCFA domain-containing protein [Shewanella sp. VB17]